MCVCVFWTDDVIRMSLGSGPGSGGVGFRETAGDG